MPDEDTRLWRIGELAAATGLSTRTFHHYNQIGLLTPSRRTTGGHRLYSADDVSRLSMIVLLRRAGLSLAEIKRVLETNTVDVATLIEQQSKDLEAALIDTRAFGRRLVDRPIETLIRDPKQIRELLNVVPRAHITAQPIVFLVYADVERAHRRLIEMFGFEPGPISRESDGTAGYAEITGPTGNIRLHRPRQGLSAPDPDADPASMTVVGVRDIDAHFDRACAAGAMIDRPLRTLFGMREYLAFDHEHHLWCFQQPA